MQILSIVKSRGDLTMHGTQGKQISLMVIPNLLRIHQKFQRVHIGQLSVTWNRTLEKTRVSLAVPLFTPLSLRITRDMQTTLKDINCDQWCSYTPIVLVWAINLHKSFLGAEWKINFIDVVEVVSCRMNGLFDIDVIWFNQILLLRLFCRSHQFSLFYSLIIQFKFLRISFAANKVNKCL